MKKAQTILFFILAFVFTVSAQEKQKSDCPTINVSGGGLVRVGESMTFTANVEGYDLSKLSFKWTISSGEILQGQNTPTITVLKKNDENITATVEIKGFPEGCPNTNSETAFGDPKPQAIKIGEFLNFNTQTEKTKLEELRKNFINKPYMQIYIIARFNENTSEKKVTQKLKKLGAFLMKEFSLEASRITMTKVFSESEYTEIWVVPPGADNPQP